jgi:starch phosphorylase
VDRRDQVEADNLFELLECQIVPLFYDRFEGRVPRWWVRRVKSSLRSLAPQVVASRMVKDYVGEMYEPTAIRADALSESHYARARSVAAWRQRVLSAWADIHVDSVEVDLSEADLGSTRRVEASIALGTLSADDVAVELVHGPVGANDEVANAQLVSLALAGLDDTPGHYRYAGQFVCEKAGRYGFTVRVVPHHPDVPNPADMGRIAWA